MWKKISAFLARLSDKVCDDIAENREGELKEFRKQILRKKTDSKEPPS